MKLDTLRFDTPNNAAISLQVIAELVRRGDMILTCNGQDTGAVNLIAKSAPARTIQRTMKP